MKTQIQKLFLALLLLNASSSAYAQGTAFTYQGRLTDNGNPANGSYDLRFTIYNAATSGTAVALAAIQGLNQKLTDELKRRDAENAAWARTTNTSRPSMPTA